MEIVLCSVIAQTKRRQPKLDQQTLAFEELIAAFCE